MNYPKRLYPYIYEALRLGGDETPEGRLYFAKYQNEVSKEYLDHLCDKRLRVSDDKIHKMTEYVLS
jgi:hypothetical protein